MEGTNVIFEVTKVGFAVNTKWNVFVDGKVIGKIDFKQNLTQKLSKGVHTVQFKVGVQKTQVLEINVADSDIIVECVWDGTVKNFHVVGGEDSAIGVGTEQYKEGKSNNKVSKEQVTKKKKSSILWIIGSFLIAGICVTGYIINDTNTTKTQEHLAELRQNIVRQYNTVGISKSAGDYMNLSETELQKELDKASKLAQKFIDNNEKYEDIINKVDIIDYKFKLGDMGYQKINYNTGEAFVAIPKKIVKTDKIFHINTQTEQVDTLWCIVEFSYDYTNGSKLKAGTNTLIGCLKIDVQTENVTVYSPLDYENRIVTNEKIYMPSENHIIAIKNTNNNSVIYPYKFFDSDEVELVFKTSN